MDKKNQSLDRYKYQAVPLDGGLDFVSPPSMVKSGSLTDCLNYEFVDRNGLRRIDGYFRWDNSYTIESDQEYGINVIPSGIFTIQPGELLTTSSEIVGTYPFRNLGAPFGIVTRVSYDIGQPIAIYYVRLDSAKEPTTNDTIYYYSNTLSARSNVCSSNPFPSNNLLNFPDSEIRNLPAIIGNGSGFSLYAGNPTDFGKAANVLATKVFGNSAYMVMDAYTITFNSKVSGTLDPVLYPGDVIGDIGLGGVSFILLNPELTSGTWSSGTVTSDVVQIQSGYNGAVRTDSKFRFMDTSGSTYYFSRGNLLPTTISFVNSPAKTAILYRGYSIKELTPSAPFTDFASGLGESYTTVGAVSASPVAVSFSGGGGYGACASTLRNGGGTLTSVCITDPGIGYTSDPSITFTTGGNTSAPRRRFWEWSGWRAINTGWYFPVVNGNSSSGFLTKLNRQRGPLSQVVNYNTNNKTGVPYQILNTLDFSEAQTVSTENWTSSPAGFPASTVQATGADNVSGAIRAYYANTTYRTPSIGFINFNTLKTEIPANSVITGVEVTVDHAAAVGAYFAGAGDVVAWQARACLFKTSDRSLAASERTETRLGDFREVNLSTAALNASITFGTSTDLWGNEGFTIEDFNENMGVAIDYYVVKNTGASAFSFTVPIDRVSLKLSYRSASIKYYIASSTSGGTNRNIASATLVTYNDEKGDLTQGNWDGVFQIANLNQEQYCDASSVGWIEVTNGGSGYTSVPTVTFSSGAATATAIIRDGSVVAVQINNQGTGYVGAPTITFTGGGGAGAAATAHLGPTTGALQGYGIFLDSSLTVRIGTVKSNMQYNGLDPYSAVDKEQSRYEITSANFYADESWEGIYGVSGAGRAFFFDKNYFSRIYAIPLSETNSAAKDKPRHICNYRYHLALGYRAGSVLFSKIGEPENFKGEEGAAEIGIGDKITGILPLPGQYLAVFCENSIWGIAGKTVDEFTTENISPYSGAVEYSIVSMGNKPIFVDSMGISTLEQIQEYGNFKGVRLSHKVTPWLLPRLTNIGKGYVSGNSSGFIAAYPVRSKNQYRLWFRDGVQLVMSFVGAEAEPVFTFSRFIYCGTMDSSDTIARTFTYTSSTDKINVLALSSDVDSLGNEHILFSIDAAKSTYRSSLSLGDLCVYKIDYLNQFDFALGSGIVYPTPIPAYFQTSFSTLDNPFKNKTIKKIRAEGVTRGLGSLSVATEKAYASPDIFSDVLVNIPLNKTDILPIYDKSIYKPASNIASVAETDRIITIKFVHTTQTKFFILELDSSNFTGSNYLITRTPNPNFLSTYCEPSHYIQLLLIQYEEGREDA